MKIEKVLFHYLLKNKELPLQGIGTFFLNASVPDNAENDKSLTIADDAIIFKYDPKVGEDAKVIDYIVQNTGKIRPLASSDLDSYLMLGRQFLNIGNPFIMPDIGTLQKNNAGEIIFKGGLHVATKVSSHRVKIEDEGQEPHEENMFNDYRQERSNNGGKILLIITGLLVLGFVGWAIYHYLFQKHDEPKVSSVEEVIPLPDSTNFKDSVAAIIKAQDTLARSPENSFTFKVVISEAKDSAIAKKRVDRYKTFGRKVIMYSTDSVHYKVAEGFDRPISDTSIIMDSLMRFYGKRKFVIEK